jgi:hypothetical protein
MAERNINTMHSDEGLDLKKCYLEIALLAPRQSFLIATCQRRGSSSASPLQVQPLLWQNSIRLRRVSKSGRDRRLGIGAKRPLSALRQWHTGLYRLESREKSAYNTQSSFAPYFGDTKTN